MKTLWNDLTLQEILRRVHARRALRLRPVQVESNELKMDRSVTHPFALKQQLAIVTCHIHSGPQLSNVPRTDSLRVLGTHIGPKLLLYRKLPHHGQI